MGAGEFKDGGPCDRPASGLRGRELSKTTSSRVVQLEPEACAGLMGHYWAHMRTFPHLLIVNIAIFHESESKIG